MLVPWLVKAAAGGNAVAWGEGGSRSEPRWLEQPELRLSPWPEPRRAHAPRDP